MPTVRLVGGGAQSEAVRRIAPSVFGVPVDVPPAGEYVANGAARQAAWAISGAAESPCLDEDSGRWPGTRQLPCRVCGSVTSRRRTVTSIDLSESRRRGPMTEAMVPAGQHTVRLHNLRLVLSEIATSPGSRADLAQRTGPDQGHRGQPGRSLHRRGILLEGHPEAAGPGRPSRSLQLSPRRAGGGGRGDQRRLHGAESGRPDRQVGQLSASRGRQPGAARCRDPGDRGPAVSALPQRYGRPLLGGVSGCPARSAPAVWWCGRRTCPPSTATRSERGLRPSCRPAWRRRTGGERGEPGRAGRPRAAADAEPDFVYVSGEIGVGAGLVVDGELFRGVHGFAGELGHVVVERDGPPCGCGGRGCVEQYAGQDVLLAAAGAAGRGGAGDRGATATRRPAPRSRRRAPRSASGWPRC